MLRAGVRGENPIVICGLADCNIAKMKSGFPIKADFRSFGIDMPGQLVIFHGPTEADMEKMLCDHGLIGDQTERTSNPRLDQEASIRAEYERILIATVGLPRSGKTTWARNSSYPIVNPDSIRLALHGQRIAGEAEPMVWVIAKYMVRSLHLAGRKIVVLDATNISRKRRDEWKSKFYGLFFKPIKTDQETCLRRAEAEGDAEMLPVIVRMAGEFEPLSAEEKRWP